MNYNLKQKIKSSISTSIGNSVVESVRNLSLESVETYISGSVFSLGWRSIRNSTTISIWGSVESSVKSRIKEYEF